MTMPGLSYDEWAAVLQSATEPVTDGLPIEAWCEKLMLSRRRTTEWIRAGLQNGFVEQVIVVRPIITGGTRRTPGFRVKEAPT